MPLRRNPLIYEINTVVWLADLTRRFGRPVLLGDVPTQVLDELAALHFDAVWLMGVWEHSPRAREIALSHPDLVAEYDRLLPDWTPDQITGSPYAVHRYVVDEHFGGQDGLATLRQALRDRGLGLILDFVPNHVALDHPWTTDCPDCLVRGTEADSIKQPGTYFIDPANGQCFAHGRDPYFPAWSDTVQIDAFSSAARDCARRTLLDIAAQCDGVRCDMAMLLVNRIFARTWTRPPSAIPATEYWTEIIPPIKAQYPDFVFMAEVYWDMEAELQSLGFDYCYDKRLYDRLLHETLHNVRDHLLAPLAYQQKLVRFIENHDEPRAVTAFGPDRSLAAATLAMALPGAKLIYAGQLQGRQIKIPVQMGQCPEEPPVAAIEAYYCRLLGELNEPIYHDGIYLALGTRPVLNSDGGFENILAFAWTMGDDWRIVAVNLTDERILGRVMLPWPFLSGPTRWQFTDKVGDLQPIFKTGDEVLVTGLEIELQAYGSAILAVTRA